VVAERSKGMVGDPISFSPDEICNGVRWRFRRRDALHYSLLRQGNTRSSPFGLSLSSLPETLTAFRLIPIKALASTPRSYHRQSPPPPSLPRVLSANYMTQSNSFQLTTAFNAFNRHNFCQFTIALLIRA